MEFKKTSYGFVIKVEPGEEIHQVLSKVCQATDISSGFLSGIGAVQQVELGYFDIQHNQYQFKKIDRALEIVSLSGNIALVDGEPMAHLHGIFSDANFQVVAGHVKSATVSVTGELCLVTDDTTVKRSTDEKTGLKLWDLK